ncbi:MAG: hypothetical protein ACKPKO_34280, partial [Candidatus Fonsibacter sp.]
MHEDNLRERQAGVMVCVPAWCNGMFPAWAAQGRGLKPRRGPSNAFVFESDDPPVSLTRGQIAVA